MTGTTDDYVMGRTSAEAERLQFQAEMLAPHSAHLFRLAGITPGMRGSAIGVDIDPDILDVARAEAAGPANTSFVQADLADLRLDESVDALLDSVIPRYAPDIVRSALPATVKYGIATESEVDIVAAWARRPGTTDRLRRCCHDR
jgi:SAM-dependent methyltransferase